MTLNSIPFFGHPTKEYSHRFMHLPVSEFFKGQSWGGQTIDDDTIMYIHPDTEISKVTCEVGMFGNPIYNILDLQHTNKKWKVRVNPAYKEFFLLNIIPDDVATATTHNNGITYRVDNTISIYETSLFHIIDHKHTLLAYIPLKEPIPVSISFTAAHYIGFIVDLNDVYIHNTPYNLDLSGFDD